MNAISPQVPHEGARLSTLKSQDPNVLPLDCSIDADGLVMSEWEPTAEELAVLLRGGHIRLWTYTGNRPFQPVHLEVAE